MFTAPAKKSNKAFWQQMKSLLNTINQICFLLICVYITLLACILKIHDTDMHLFKTAIGFYVLSGEALMSHNLYNSITNRLSHRNQCRFHGIVQIIGGSMVLLGDLKISITTLHGRLVIAAYFMCFASLLSYCQPKFIRKINFRHNLFGMATFTSALTIMILGYFPKILAVVLAVAWMILNELIECYEAMNKDIIVTQVRHKRPML